MTKITAIGIDTGDNDFYPTHIETLNIMKSLVGEELTKKQLAICFNEMVGGVYLAVQNKFGYFNGRDESTHIRSTKQYLQIHPRSIYINEEVDKFIKEQKDWSNGEFFFTDGDKVGCI